MAYDFRTGERLSAPRVSRRGSAHSGHSSEHGPASATSHIRRSLFRRCRLRHLQRYRDLSSDKAPGMRFATSLSQLARAIDNLLKMQRKRERALDPTASPLR